ncbi:hypothetical protein NESM_000261800 [Novymonas esmeraldas]|uniref:Uncharacterized protein n=1 Tax=Novymonas esmeraldas TaxID=1808958 RepID=A0AAW0FAH9_9TRYP
MTAIGESPAFRDGAQTPTADAARRDDSHAARVRREPISTHDEEEESEVIVREGGERRDSSGAPIRRTASLDVLMERLIFHVDGPIDNLPELAAPELKLIGRCVSFQVRQRIGGAPAAWYHYTGIVSGVTAQTVTMMQVNRYTHVDYKAYKEREWHLVKGKAIPVEASSSIGRGGGYAFSIDPMMRAPAPRSPASARGLVSYGYTADGEVGVDEDGHLTAARDTTKVGDWRLPGSLAPATALVTDVELRLLAEERRRIAQHDRHTVEGLDRESGAAEPQHHSRAARHRHFRAFDGSVGPIPYVTFLRKNIHDVHFGRDPRSAFYSLFQEPAKQITDMQYLRMFVRRYLVHTSQGNNPREVPLYAFVSVRCAWPTLDRELVNQIVHEELPRLVLSSRDIEKNRKQQRLRLMQRELQTDQYHAPVGMFTDTGVLYLTRIPQAAFIAALLTLVLTLVFAVYLGVVIAVHAEPMVVRFAASVMPFFVTALVVWAVAGVAMMVHASMGHIPLRSNVLLLTCRCIMTLASIACGVMVLAAVLRKWTEGTVYSLMRDAQGSSLCSFYDEHTCTGYRAPCGTGTDDPILCSVCPTMPVTERGCHSILWARVRVAMVPLLVFAAAIVTAALYSTYLLVRLFMYAKSTTGSIL